MIYKPIRLSIQGSANAVEVPAGIPVIYSRGVDTVDGDAKVHQDDGSIGDIVVWPPLRMLEREQDLRD